MRLGTGGGRRAALAAIVIAGIVGLAGCGVIHLYDPAKEKVSGDIKARYAEVKLLELIDTEKKNLDALLSEELAAAREADRVILDLELFRIAEGSEAIGRSLAWRARKDEKTQVTTVSPDGRLAVRLQQLGWDSVGELRKALQQAVVPRQAESSARLIYSATGRRAPPCDATDFDEALSALSRGLAPDKARNVEEDAKDYKTACGQFTPVNPKGGEIRLAYEAWQAAKNEAAQRRARVVKAQTAFERAVKEHDDALKAVRDADNAETRARLKKAADALREAVAGLGGTSEAVGVSAVPAERARAIDVILGALAGGEVDAKKLKDDPELARAASVAEGVPAIAEGIEKMVKRARAPALGSLVLEKEHQLLLRDHAARLEQLQSRRMLAQEARYRALVLESRYLMEQHDAVCRFAGVQSKQNVGACDEFKVTLTPGGTDGKTDIMTCQLPIKGPPETLVGDQCPVSASWAKKFWESSGDDEARRYLYRAIIALVQRFTVARAQQDEADYGLIHLLHLEVSAADEYAIRAWNSLIATPVNQLAAYHQSGIKPAELADLIVKAVGLAAIGIGVNR